MILSGKAERNSDRARQGFVGIVGITERGSREWSASRTRTATVPIHREVAAGTIRSILRQVGLSESAFEQL
jgi:predicted RNA binding protein YcfA (HicA-like mRNA interferase family)